MGFPKSEEETQKFKDSVLCLEGSRAWVDSGQDGRLVSLQERLEAKAAVEATRTAGRHKNNFKIPDEIREISGGGDKMQESSVDGRSQEQGKERKMRIRRQGGSSAQGKINRQR